MKKILFLFFCVLPYFVPAQDIEQQLADLERQKTELQDTMATLDIQIEEAKLAIIRSSLVKFATPALVAGEELIEHAAMALVYSEAHEQAKWVAHVITPDVLTGSGYRTNDFRSDPKVLTGTAVEADYFLKSAKANGEFEYDGFGYDRGHLAPSADFRWSKTALSESYFYSNMSPQLADFNREIWADLENAIRGYLYRNPASTLYVTTGGMLNDNLTVIERSINKVSIPEYFFKVVFDRKNQRSIGFLLPHRPSDQPLETFAFSIDELEAITGLDFFHGLPDAEENSVEAHLDKSLWLPTLQDGNVASLTLATVPRKKSYPATFGKKFMSQDITVNICGTIVGGRHSRKGNLLLNMDKKFPDQIFTIFIKKEYLINFGYDPLTLVGSQVCVKGTVDKIGSTATMFLEDAGELEVVKEKRDGELEYDKSK